MNIFLFIFIISTNAKVLSFGGNTYGQLGLDNTDSTEVPIEIFNTSEITSINTNYDHALFLDVNSNLYSLGRNNYKQLGLGNTGDKWIHTKIQIYNIISICTGFYHSLILDNKGDVYSFGYNFYGQLGLNDTLDRNIPTIIPYLSNIKDIYCNGYHSAVISEQGYLYLFGNNENEQLGVNNTNIDKVLIPTLLQHSRNIIHVTVGGYHTIFLDDQGDLYGFGENDRGQLGLGDTDRRLVTTLIPFIGNISIVDCGERFCMILTTDGKVFSFGEGSDGQLGLSGFNDVYIPTLINNIPDIKSISTGYDHSLILDIDGSVYGFGSNFFGQLAYDSSFIKIVTPNLIQNIQNASQIQAGYQHSLVLIYEENYLTSLTSSTDNTKSSIIEDKTDNFESIESDEDVTSEEAVFDIVLNNTVVRYYDLNITDQIYTIYNSDVYIDNNLYISMTDIILDESSIIHIKGCLILESDVSLIINITEHIIGSKKLINTSCIIGDFTDIILVTNSECRESFQIDNKGLSIFLEECIRQTDIILISIIICSTLAVVFFIILLLRRYKRLNRKALEEIKKEEDQEELELKLYILKKNINSTGEDIRGVENMMSDLERC